MRYITLNEDVDPVPAAVRQSDGSIKDETCIKVLVALDVLTIEAKTRVATGFIGRMQAASNYQDGRRAAFAQASRMLRGILNGEYSAEHITSADIRKMTAE